MPNHVSTNLYVKGNSTDVKKFVELANKDGKFSFDGLLPLPTEFVGTISPAKILTDEQYLKDKAEYDALPESERKWRGIGMTQLMSDALLNKYGADNWYDWCNRNWGTKWGAYDSTELVIGSSDKTDSVAGCFYMTAWSPATAFYETISEKFPTLEFKHEFADEGGGFVGYEVIKDGEITDSEDYPWDSEQGIFLREQLGMTTDDESEDEESEDVT